MKIYTKTGDKGETAFFGGQRVRKSDPRIRAYGEVDELNACLGLARSLNKNRDIDSLLKKIQNDLFDLGALLAKATGFIRPEDTQDLEKTIDRLETDLPPLKQFILPGGNPAASALHLARTICRRAEREIVSLAEKDRIEGEILIYINRLSDWLFVVARWVNHQEGVPETAWEKK